MANIKFFTGMDIPLELHKVRMVQKLNLQPVERRAQAIAEAGNNTFLLKNEDIFLDMLTDSGVNAMSDRQTAAMLICDDSYAGSASFTRLENKVHEIFGTKFFLPAHQGRACENILAMAFVKPGDVVPMNFHFTTTKAHITRLGGRVEELVIDEGLATTSDCPFKGNFDLDKLRKLIAEVGAEHIPFLRVEAGTNLIGGQPLSLQNMRETCAICREHGIMTVLDASLLQDNLHFIKTREAACKDMSIREITRAVAEEFDIIYFSARKFGFARGGGIAMREQKLCEQMRELVPMFEGFLTYGGMSVREMEAITVGLEETMDEDVISQGPIFIDFMCRELQKRGVPVVTPAGGLGCHLNAREVQPHIHDHDNPAGVPGGRHPRHGARHALRAARARRHGAHCGRGAAAPGGSEARVHYEPAALRGGQDNMAVREPRTGGRPALGRGTELSAFLLRPPRPDQRLAGEARRQIPRRLRRQPLIYPGVNSLQKKPALKGRFLLRYSDVPTDSLRA